jgi:hypothetical protein
MIHQDGTRFLFLVAAGALFVVACSDGDTSSSSSGSSSSTGMSTTTGAGGGSSSGDGGGGGGAGDNAVACDNRAIDSTCAYFPSGTTMAEAEMSCDGSVITMPCPLEEAVGICSIMVAKGTLTNTYYAGGPKPWTEATASTACADLMGDFKKP